MQSAPRRRTLHQIDRGVTQNRHNSIWSARSICQRAFARRKEKGNRMIEREEAFRKLHSQLTRMSVQPTWRCQTAAPQKKRWQQFRDNIRGKEASRAFREKTSAAESPAKDGQIDGGARASAPNASFALPDVTDICEFQPNPTDNSLGIPHTSGYRNSPVDRKGARDEQVKVAAKVGVLDRHAIRGQRKGEPTGGGGGRQVRGFRANWPSTTGNKSGGGR